MLRIHERNGSFSMLIFITVWRARRECGSLFSVVS